ncbi:MAG: hypothetical protein MUE60_10080, partial [Candidatus Eisenbacteria bacterium]|nr:hypothetical protein [Candidatus Eisenbacteria bacterium]
STTTSIVGSLSGLGRGLIVGYQERTSLITGAPASYPAPPSYVHAQPLSLNEIHLHWSVVPGADAYRVFRGPQRDSLSPWAVTDTAECRDSTVTPLVEYWYAVSTIDSSLSPPEGVPSHAVSAITDEPPMLLGAVFVPPYHVRLTFSKALDESSAREPGHYQLGSAGLTPASAVMTDQEHGVLLAFRDLPADDGAYTLAVSGVRDLSGIAVPAGTSIAVTIERQGSFYVERASYLGRNVVSVVFNAPPDSSLTVASFSSDPPLLFGEIQRDGLDPGEVRLALIPPPGRADGTVYTLFVSTARDVHGNDIQPGVGSRSSLTFFAEDLLSWRVSPNPCRPDGSPTVLRFVGVPQDAVVGIWDLAGRLVQEVRESTPDGMIRWDGRARSGDLLGSGVYIYRVHSSIGEKSGRIVAIR